MNAAGAETVDDALRARAAPLPRSIWRRRGDASLTSLSGPIRLAVFTSPFIVRWAAWLVALLVVLLTTIPHDNRVFEPYLLIGTFVQTLAVTFYVPLIRPVLLPALRRRIYIAENADVLWLGLIDVTLSMTAVYLSGGWGSPYFHFALTALLIPSFFMTFRGVLGLAFVYTAAYVAGVAIFGDALNGSWRDSNLNGFIGAVITPLLVALVPNYLGSVLRDLDVARQEAVDALSDSELLFRIGRAFLERGHEVEDVLRHVADSAIEASRFDRLLLLVPDALDGAGETHAYGADVHAPEPARLAAAIEGAGARTIVATTLPPPLDAVLVACGWAAAVPLQSSDAVEGWLIAGMRERPVAILHEVRLLDAVGGQMSMGVRNLRLSARIGELAAEGERSRIAREIHDGIAQMVFMLTLSLETAIDRVGGDPEEQRQRLRDLTALAKNALWEVRQYIFDLRPLLSGEEGLVGAVQGQVREFKAVSELPVELTVTGTPVPLPVATSAELYRIVQEGLGNIFRHARASSVQIALGFAGDRVTLSISDDGVGLGTRDPDARVGYGMGNLQQRVEELRGRLAVQSTPGAGTRIDVSVPTGDAA
ncbi:MAG TPA: histidine kinase [Dehalococcoidia bacterium]